MGPSSISPSPTPSTLTSLPRELVTRIALLLDDLPSALSLSLVCRFTAPSAATRIWREMVLSGEPHSEGGSDRSLPTADEKRAEDERAAALKEKVNCVLRGGPQRWALIRTIKMVPQTGTATGMLHVLDVAKHLRKLDISAGHAFDPLRPYHSLEYQLLTHPIHFPSLTHLRIGKCGLHSAEIIPLLCNACPLLVDLSADLSAESLKPDGWAGNPKPGFPKFERPTAVKRLSLCFTDPENGCYQGYQHAHTEPTSPILRLIRHCPQVQQLIILNRSSHSDCSDQLYPALVRMISELAVLRDLYWMADTGVIDPDPKGPFDQWDTQEGFQSLTRLLLSFCAWSAIFTSIPMLPQLQTLYLDTNNRIHHIPNATDDSPTSSPLAMTPAFSTRIRNSPRLHTVRSPKSRFFRASDLLGELDIAEESEDTVIGRVRSLRHAGSELLRVSLLSDFVEVGDFAAASVERVEPFRYLRYTAVDGTKRVKAFERREEATWRDYTDWDGVVVPLAVIEDMRREEGVSPAEWERRDVEVEAETWRVLMDWKQGLEEAAQAEWASAVATSS